MSAAAVARIEATLRAAGTPERAAGSKRYLKSEMEHLGSRVPQIRAEVKPAARQVSSHGELVSLAQGLWERPIFELRAAAAFLLDARVDLLGPRDLPFIRRLVGESHTWALVDPLSADLLGDLLVAHPKGATKLDSWARDRDFWVRRAALLSQIAPLKAGASFERFGGWADAMLDEREFFIRKAIGWVLREAGKTRPEMVFEWLEPRAARASGVTMREAVKYLPETSRRSLREAREG